MLMCQAESGKRFSLTHLLFAHHAKANGSLSFVHLLTKKQKDVIRLQTDKTDQMD